MSRLDLDTDELAAAAATLLAAADLLAAAREHLTPRGGRPAGHPVLDAAVGDLGTGWSARHLALVEALTSWATALRGAAARFADAERVTAAGLARLLAPEPPCTGTPVPDASVPCAPAPGTPAPGSPAAGSPTTATAL